MRRLPRLVLAATVGIAGLLQLSILLLRRGDGVAAWLRVRFDGEMRSFFAKAIPGMIASSGPQLLMVAGAIIASSSPSAVSWLYFANRLIELPLGLVGVAMGTVLVPELSRAVHGEDRSGDRACAIARRSNSPSGWRCRRRWGCSCSASRSCRMLFEHGAFTATDTAATARALMWLALGLPAHVLFKALCAGFFRAREHHHAAGRGAEGHRARDRRAPSCSAICSAPRASPPPSRSGPGAARCRCCARARTHSDFPSMPPRENACRASSRRRWRWAGCCGWRRDSCRIADLHGLAQAAVLLVLIAGGIAIYGLILGLFGVTGWREAVNAVRQNRPAACATRRPVANDAA